MQQKKIGVQYLAQGHFYLQTEGAGNRTVDLNDPVYLLSYKLT